MWFRRKRDQQALPQRPEVLKSGLAFRVIGGDYYLVKGERRYRFPTRRIFDSWSLEAVPIFGYELESLEDGGVLGFREGTLTKNAADGKLYLISENKRCHITTPDLEYYGLAGRKVINVSQRELDLHDEGDELP